MNYFKLSTAERISQILSIHVLNNNKVFKFHITKTDISRNISFIKLMRVLLSFADYHLLNNFNFPG